MDLLWFISPWSRFGSHPHSIIYVAPVIVLRFVVQCVVMFIPVHILHNQPDWTNVHIIRETRFGMRCVNVNDPPVFPVLHFCPT
jgi:hypothetical protein